MAEETYTLTPAQRAQLRALWAVGATTYATAAAALVIPGFEPRLAPLLQAMGLIAQARPVGPGGHPRYHLTPAGVGEARKPTLPAQGGARHG